MPKPKRRTQLNMASMSGAFYQALCHIRSYALDHANGVIITPERAKILGYSQQLFYRLGLESWPSQRPTSQHLNGLYKVIQQRRQYRKAIAKAAARGLTPDQVGLSDADLRRQLSADADILALVSYLKDAFSYDDGAGPTQLVIGQLTAATISYVSRPVLEQITTLDGAIPVLQHILREETRLEAEATGQAEPVYDRVDLGFNPDLSRNEYEAATDALIGGDIATSAIATEVAGTVPVDDGIYAPMPPFDGNAGMPDIEGV